jgi:hypothetical protein
MLARISGNARAQVQKNLQHSMVFDSRLYKTDIGQYTTKYLFVEVHRKVNRESYLSRISGTIDMLETSHFRSRCVKS